MDLPTEAARSITAGVEPFMVVAASTVVEVSMSVVVSMVVAAGDKGEIGADWN
jgi:hypothetical protein